MLLYEPKVDRSYAIAETRKTDERGVKIFR